MIPRILLGTASIPGTDKEMRLYQSGDLFSIKIPGRGDLMNSRMHGSEKALADLACARIGGNDEAAAADRRARHGVHVGRGAEAVGPDAEVVVAELVPEVVTWNRTLIGAPAGHPLADPRSRVYVGDVADVIRREAGGFDAILMDVDNGPEALVRRENDWLYGPQDCAPRGPRCARTACWPSGPRARIAPSASGCSRPASTCASTWCVRIAPARGRAITFGSPPERQAPRTLFESGSVRPRLSAAAGSIAIRIGPPVSR